MNPVLFNIQKFSIHDGAGIRTTVFFKGCPLRCLWCHNPESQRYTPEIMYYADRCVHCGACAAVCPTHAISEDIQMDRSRCEACGLCTTYCLYGARERVGYQEDVDVLIDEILKDAPFYEVSGGGVTLSGGEPLAQDMDYIESICRRLKRRGYRVDIDTCGHVPYDHFARILPYVDTFLYDLKHMDPEKHKALTGVSNEAILKNLRQLSDDGGRIRLRLPLISGLNDDEAEIRALCALLAEIHVEGIHLLPYHTAGSDKYERLGEKERTFKAPSEERLHEIRSTFLSCGIPVKIGG
ncbi:MAG: glycyl-radical enzyme activating protein [Clostridiales bacterium]|nr:glycyl-radical enzyme activating protein [Clostridiales bacterium]